MSGIENLEIRSKLQNIFLKQQEETEQRLLYDMYSSESEKIKEILLEDIHTRDLLKIWNTWLNDMTEEHKSEVFSKFEPVYVFQGVKKKIKESKDYAHGRKVLRRFVASYPEIFKKDKKDEKTKE
jgi:hypothetical protein